ncbi:MAG: RICIN domain-containing protein [Bacteroides sp.]|nr:RICIN domain-containing protein [Roseburia sp.]MCM1346399.1 RICIN domain-containing protein [Bacteroides sp.]MCM1420958.1 RICIN domain-containing protein [Bacteroides sp.]
MRKLSFFLSMICLLFVCKAFGQALSPTVIYQIENESGLMMSYNEGSCNLATSDAGDSNQQWYVVLSEDGLFHLKNVASGKYLGLITSEWNTWNCYFYDEDELTESIDHAQYTIEDIDGEYYGLKLKCSSKYLGLDNIDEGSTVFCDKGISNYGKWKFVALASDAQTAYLAAYNSVITYAEENFLEDYSTIYDFISDSLMNISSIYDTPDDEILEAGTLVLQDFLRSVKSVKVSLGTMDKNLQRMIELIQLTNYPGIDVLNAEYEKYSDMLGEDITFAEAISAPNEMEEVIKAYYLSQIPSATETNPADLSYFIKNPSFREELEYTDECTVTSNGWTTQSVDLPDEGVDVAAKRKGTEEVGRNTTCFNMWSWQFSTMSVNQELNGLPEGRYVITCEGWTNGEVIAQHAYATSNSGITVESNYATEAMLSMDWEKFTTPEINVSDGYLKIGFISKKEDKGGSDGWFLVTDFKLLYVGELGTSAVLADIQNRIAVAEQIGLTLKGDKTKLDAAVAAARAVNGNSDLTEAQAILEKLNDAIVVAQAAAEKYKNFAEGTYTSVCEYASTLSEQQVKDFVDASIARVDAVIASDTTTYVALAEQGNLLNAAKAYAELYTERVVGALANTSLNAEAVANLKTVVENNWNALKTVSSTPGIRLLTVKLTVAVDDAMLTQPAGENTEMSFLIKNADATDSGNNYLSGWDVSKGNGNTYTSAGESFTKNSSDRYIDSYNSTAGTLKYTAKQTVYNLPNGTYRMKVATRANGENAVVFALSGETLYKSSIVNKGNEGGEIYQDAFDKAYQDAIEAGVPEDEIDETTLDIQYASKGWGWSYIENIEVTNHELTIGVSTDSEVTLEDAFTGTWFSADKFSLYYLVAGDNSDFGFTTPVEAPVSDKSVSISVIAGQIIVNGAEDVKIYNVSGMNVANAALPSGIYVVYADGKSYKVFVK